MLFRSVKKALRLDRHRRSRMCCYEPTSDPLHPRSEHTREVQITATGRRPTACLSSCELSLSLSLFSHRTGTRTQLLPPAMLSNIRCLAFALVMGLLAVASGEIGRVQAAVRRLILEKQCVQLLNRHHLRPTPMDSTVHPPPCRDRKSVV